MPHLFNALRSVLEAFGVQGGVHFIPAVDGKAPITLVLQEGSFAALLAVVSQPHAWRCRSRTCLISFFMQEASVPNQERPEVKCLWAVLSQPPHPSSGLLLSSLSPLLELSFFWLSPEMPVLWPGRVMDCTVRL